MVHLGKELHRRIGLRLRLREVVVAASKVVDAVVDAAAAVILEVLWIWLHR
jgi:hypothetical protein